MREFLLPDLGEGLEEAEIVDWHVTEGDHVVADQPLVSVETDKAVVEGPSPQSGRVMRLFGAKGDLIKVGAPLVEFAEGAEADTGTVVGELQREESSFAGAGLPAKPAPLQSLQALPAVRALARKLDVDLNLAQATGPGDRSRERTSSAPPKASPRRARPSHCGDCDARWPCE
jgi:2-oxoisovalerate dehydrogenase E2 component (dihydrolipoyl transacylase)